MATEHEYLVIQTLTRLRAIREIARDIIPIDGLLTQNELQQLHRTIQQRVDALYEYLGPLHD